MTMELPIELRQLLEEQAGTFPLKQLTAAAAKMSEKYRSETGASISGSAETCAYAVVRMPATYGAASAALEQAAKRFNGEISTMLDVGAGTGAVCWAAAEIFPDIEHTVCLERDKNMTEIGEKLMKNGGFPCAYEWKSFDLTSGAISQRAQLVTASYVLNELGSKQRAEAVKKLWNAAEKMLVIIEPGTPKGFANLLEIRSLLINSGAHIIAPCPSDGECPLPSDDWCHFSARIARTKLHKQLKGGDAPYEDEKFCYIAAVRSNTEPSVPRIIRHPKIESGKITLELCTADGITQKIVTKKDGAAFKKARKADWGDDFSCAK